MLSPPRDAESAARDAARDAALIAAIRDGDPAALESLARTYGESLIRYSARFVESIDRAREVVQDVFFVLWRDRATLTITRDVAAYLFWRTRNHARHVAHADRSSRARDARWTTDWHDGAASRPSSADSADAADVRASVWDALSGVPPRCREVFMLVWDEQLSYAEVATILGISIPTARNQMSRALKHLVAVLGSRFGER